MADPEFKEIEKASRIYGTFMEEIKTRLNVIAGIVTRLKANPNDPEGFLQAEFGFLQLRFICDLIALSVLAVHKPYGLTDQLLESWHARRALNDLKAINPVSFPRPCKITGEEGKKHIDWTTNGALDRQGLQRIYDKCGKLLHRGIIKHMFEGQQKAYDIGAMDRWASRIGALLSHHALIYPERPRHYRLSSRARRRRSSDRDSPGPRSGNIRTVRGEGNPCTETVSPSRRETPSKR